MSSCFFSSRLKIRISANPVLLAMSTTALPKVPVPPVINRVRPANILEFIWSECGSRASVGSEQTYAAKGSACTTRNDDVTKLSWLYAFPRRHIQSLCHFGDLQR